MHSLQAEARTLATKIAGFSAPASVEVAIFPPFTALHMAASAVKNSKVKLGAQDCSNEKVGAFTGEVSALMLKDAGCHYVLVGHSERRTLHEENDALVKAKAQAAMDAGLVPVICIGENRVDRQTGIFLDVITSQVKKSVPTLVHSDTYMIAYEPVWAIGSGKTPTPKEISQVHKTIASLLDYGTSGARTAILYGGSVKAASAREILTAEGVDGVLVGVASLNPEEFCSIVAAAGEI